MLPGVVGSPDAKETRWKERTCASSSLGCSSTAPPSIELRRVVGSGDVWAVEARSDYDGRIYYVVMIVEFGDGKIMREARCYADPFEAPEWRADWIEATEAG